MFSFRHHLVRKNVTRLLYCFDFSLKDNVKIFATLFHTLIFPYDIKWIALALNTARTVLPCSNPISLTDLLVTNAVNENPDRKWTRMNGP